MGNQNETLRTESQRKDTCIECIDSLLTDDTMSESTVHLTKRDQYGQPQRAEGPLRCGRACPSPTPPRRTAAIWKPPLAPEHLLIHYNTPLARDEGLHIRAGQGGAWRAEELRRQMGTRRWRRRWTPGAFYVEAAAVAHLSAHLDTHTDEVSRRSGGASPTRPCERERRPPIVALPSAVRRGRSMTGDMTGSVSPRESHW